jgi:hypothetical protein
MDATTNIGIDAVAPRLKRLVLQPASYRNVDGSFSDREPAATMSLATLDLACRRVFDSPRFDRWNGTAVNRCTCRWPGTRKPSR